MAAPLWVKVVHIPTATCECVGVCANNIYIFSAVSENERSPWTRAETRKDKQTIALAGLTVTHFLHSQNKQDYFKHRASSSRLSSSSLRELHPVKRKKMNPGSSLLLWKVLTLLLNPLGHSGVECSKEIIKLNWFREKGHFIPPYSINIKCELKQ